MVCAYDVESLFTNVPIDAAVQDVQQKLEDDQSLVDRTTVTPTQIADLLNFVLRSTYLQCNGSIYEQIEGAAMGSQVSAILCVESFKQQVLSTSSYKPRIWKRFVDDTFTILECRNVDGFL